MTRKTILNDSHRSLGARMVDFGGWDMPIHYGSQIDEHHQVRRDAGMFDVSHMTVVDLHGGQVRAFLRRLVANSVDKLKQPGKALYACMLNEQGGIIDDLIIYYLREDWFRLVVNASTREKDLAWIGRHAEGFGVEVRERDDLAMIAVQGPNARERVIGLVGGDAAALEALGKFAARELADTRFGELFIARTGYTGEDGFEIVVPQEGAVALWDALLQAGVKPAGLGARDTLRLEAGMNLYGHEMTEEVNPLVAGLAWTVSFKDADRRFIGREAIEGVTPQHTMVGVRLRERGVMREHMKVRTDKGEGLLTSGTMSPSMGVSIGMARVPVGVQAGDPAEVEIRGKWLPADIVSMPFVRQGKVLV